ncbi:MAG: phospholipase D family protein [Phycisphaerae bacterium]|nr:phospholipase D family protein [Phycisphaerae bacterium]
MLQVVLNYDHLTSVLGEALSGCRHRLLIATANVKDLHVPISTFDPGGRATRAGRAESILQVFEALAERNIEIRLLHGGVPSGPFLKHLKQNVPRTLIMRRCPRMHVKTVIADGRWMYLGSANLTGAGLGAKSPRRRNFEAGICTDELALIDPVADMLDRVWNGLECNNCGRRDHCPVPLEEPQL